MLFFVFSLHGLSFFQTPPGPTETRGDLPTPEEAAALLQSQSNYSQQLEAENRYLKVSMVREHYTITTHIGLS